jgi:hypothetical protein
MCLKIDPEKRRPTQVYHRWKFLEVKEFAGLDMINGKLTPVLCSPVYYYKWEVGKENYNNSLLKYNQYGFHVYTTKRHALGAIKNWTAFNKKNEDGKKVFALVKLKVKDFKYAGVIDNCDDYSNGKPCEIWCGATITNVYDPVTGKDITEQYDI